jgi:hypothetical protein
LRTHLRRPGHVLRHRTAHRALLRHRARWRRGAHRRLRARGRRMECWALRRRRWSRHRCRTSGRRSMGRGARRRGPLRPRLLRSLRTGGERHSHPQRHNNREQASLNCHRRPSKITPT